MECSLNSCICTPSSLSIQVVVITRAYVNTQGSQVEDGAHPQAGCTVSCPWIWRKRFSRSAFPRPWSRTRSPFLTSLWSLPSIFHPIHSSSHSQDGPSQSLPLPRFFCLEHSSSGFLRSFLRAEGSSDSSLTSGSFSSLH